MLSAWIGTHHGGHQHNSIHDNSLCVHISTAMSSKNANSRPATRWQRCIPAEKRPKTEGASGHQRGASNSPFGPRSLLIVPPVFAKILCSKSKGKPPFFSKSAVLMAKVHEVDTILQNSAMQQQSLKKGGCPSILFLPSHICHCPFGLCANYKLSCTAQYPFQVLQGTFQTHMFCICFF